MLQEANSVRSNSLVTERGSETLCPHVKGALSRTDCKSVTAQALVFANLRLNVAQELRNRNWRAPDHRRSIDWRIALVHHRLDKHHTRKERVNLLQFTVGVDDVGFSFLSRLKPFGRSQYRELATSLYLASLPRTFPRIPANDEIKNLLPRAMEVLPTTQLWVNPDCGLKTREWLRSMAHYPTW
jgi:hypothetical protein